MTTIMTIACIGWSSDEPCKVHGQFHGCRYPENGHPGRVHRCKCGAWMAERKGR